MVAEKYKKYISLLSEEFQKRVPLCNEDEVRTKLIEEPFSVEAANLPVELKMEIIDLQCSGNYRVK